MATCKLIKLRHQYYVATPTLTLSLLTLLARQPLDPYGNISHTAGHHLHLSGLSVTYALALGSPDVRVQVPASTFFSNFLFLSSLIIHEGCIYTPPAAKVNTHTHQS